MYRKRTVVDIFLKFSAIGFARGGIDGCSGRGFRGSLLALLALLAG